MLLCLPHKVFSLEHEMPKSWVSVRQTHCHSVMRKQPPHIGRILTPASLSLGGCFRRLISEGAGKQGSLSIVCSNVCHVVCCLISVSHMNVQNTWWKARSSNLAKIANKWLMATDNQLINSSIRSRKVRTFELLLFHGNGLYFGGFFFFFHSLKPLIVLRGEKTNFVE